MKIKDTNNNVLTHTPGVYNLSKGPLGTYISTGDVATQINQFIGFLEDPKTNPETFKKILKHFRKTMVELTEKGF